MHLATPLEPDDQATSSAPPASTMTTSSPRSSARGIEKFVASVDRLLEEIRAKRRDLAAA